MHTRSKYTKWLVVVICLLGFASGVSAGVAFDWARLWGSPQNDYGRGIDIYMGSTLIYVCGQTFGSFDGQTAVSSSGDACLSSYYADGTRSWSRIWGSMLTDDARGIAVDPGSGEMYVVGFTYDAFGAGQTNQGMADAFCSKFDSTGALLWSRVWGSPSNDYAEAVVIGASGSVYVAGWTEGVFDGQTNMGASDIFVTRFSAVGDRDWSSIWGSTLADSCRDLCFVTGMPDHLFLTGETAGGFDGAVGPGNGDVFLCSVDPNNGTRPWTTIWGSAQYDAGAVISFDPGAGGDLYVAGHTDGAFGAGQTNSGGSDFFLSRVSVGGTEIWSRTWGSPADDNAFGVRSGVMSVSNGIVVAGNTYNSFDGQPHPMPGHSAFCISVFDDAGGLNDAYIWGSVSNNHASGIAVDGAGDVFVAGYTDGGFSSELNNGQNDLALTRFSPSAGTDRFVSLSGAHVWPYDNWLHAATNIQAALDASFSGDIIHVTNGTYHLNLAVTVTNDVRVESVNGSQVTILDGGASVRCLYMDVPGPVVVGFTLRNGYEPVAGGGAYIVDGHLESCVVSGNRANSGGGVYMTGGEVRNSLIAANYAMSSGGGISLSGGGIIDSCTIASNHAGIRAGGLYAENALVRNTIIDANTSPTNANIQDSSTLPSTFEHSCSVPYVSGMDNVAGPAAFMDASILDFRLSGVSPCIDTGTNEIWMLTGFDLGGGSRIMDGIVDMGAFEYAATTLLIRTMAGTHGSISPTQDIVNAGGSSTFTITPDAGYIIRDVHVNGVFIGSTNSYTFTGVMSNQVLAATFDTPAPGSLMGAVAGVSGAHIELRGTDNMMLYEGFTAADGHYRIDGINPAGYRIKVSHDDYADIWYDGSNGAHDITGAMVYYITSAGSGQTLNFSLNQGQSPALVQVSSSPSGLPIYLDFLPTGLVTPALVDVGEVDSGYDHSLWVKSTVFPWPAPVYSGGIEAETEEVPFTLTTANAGYLNVTTDPADADIFLDCTDGPVGVSPVGPIALAPGRHTLIIRKAGYLIPWLVDVDVVAGTARSVHIPLTKKYLHREDFSHGFGWWDLFGSPQSQIVDVHGHQTAFDNNGDALCDSGIISKQALDLTAGCTIKAEVYLEVRDRTSCWVHGAIALSSGQLDSGYCGTYDQIGLIEFAMIGGACTEIPEHLRGHSYIWGAGMDLAGFNADSFVNAWHTLEVRIAATGEVTLYIDEQYIGTTPVRLSADTLQNAHIVLGRRSSGGGGKFYMDNVVVAFHTENEVVHVSSQPDAATIYLDYLPVDALTDTVLDGFEPLAFHGEGWSSQSHRIMLNKMGYLPTAPRMAPPDVAIELIPASSNYTRSVVFKRRMKDPRDLDGDALTDVSCYDESAGMWYMYKSHCGFVSEQFGFEGTIPVSGDYDGDGIQDITVFWPEGGCWYILQSSDDMLRIVHWGWPAVWPVPGDYDGDQKTDIAVFWPEAGTWFIQLSETGDTRVEHWGWDAAVPVVADYDGDGYSDVSVYWPEGGCWYILQSALQKGKTVEWGWGESQPVPADFDGDGQADIAVYWPQGGNWFILQSSDGKVRTENWGWSESLPVTGDYDGDGKADLTVYWPDGAYWYLLKSYEGSSAIPLGTDGATPVQ